MTSDIGNNGLNGQIELLLAASGENVPEMENIQFIDKTSKKVATLSNEQMLKMAEQSGHSAILSSDRASFLDQKQPLTKLFTKGKLLGKGAYSSVASYTYERKTYAIKEYKRNGFVAYREFLIGQKLNSPFFVRIHNAVRKQNKLYLIMEYVPGKTLHYLATKTPEALDCALLLPQMFQGYEYAAKQLILLNDIHRKNVIITPEQEWKYLDVGNYVDFSRTSPKELDTATMSPEFWLRAAQLLTGSKETSSPLAAQLTALGHSHSKRVRSDYSRAHRETLTHIAAGQALLKKHLSGA